MYNLVYASDSGQGCLAAIDSHNTALLFMILCLGTFLDGTDYAAQQEDAEQYHQLARTAMSCDPILVDPTMPSIRTLASPRFRCWLRLRASAR